jgi:hypothetical protein
MLMRADIALMIAVAPIPPMTVAPNFDIQSSALVRRWFRPLMKNESRQNAPVL